MGAPDSHTGVRPPTEPGRGVTGTPRGSLFAMKNALIRLVRSSRSPQGLKLIRYTLVSVISALTSLIILTIVYGVLRLWNEVYSTLFANVLAGIPSYLLNRQWVWGKSGRSHIWREIVPFWVMSIVGILFALLVAGLAQHYARVHDLAHLERTVLVVGANIFAFGVLWLLKFFLFNRLFAEIADIEVGPEVPEVEMGPENAI
jgi:putative flippase GtrA